MLELGSKPLLWTIRIDAYHIRIQSNSISNKTILNQIRPISN
jgi:hypothetical protein